MFIFQAQKQAGANQSQQESLAARIEAVEKLIYQQHKDFTYGQKEHIDALASSLISLYNNTPGKKPKGGKYGDDDTRALALFQVASRELLDIANSQGFDSEPIKKLQSQLDFSRDINENTFAENTGIAEKYYSSFLRVLGLGYMGKKGEEEFILTFDLARKFTSILEKARRTGRSDFIEAEFSNEDRAGKFAQWARSLPYIRLYKGQEEVQVLQEGRKVSLSFEYDARGETAQLELPVRSLGADAQKADAAATGARVAKKLNKSYKHKTGFKEESISFENASLGAGSLAASSSNSGKTDYDSSTQLEYARKFDPKSPSSVNAVRQMAMVELNMMAHDLGYDMKGDDGKELALSEFLLNNEGREFLKALYRNGEGFSVKGRATNESPSQGEYDRNMALAKVRGEMLKDGIVNLLREAVAAHGLGIDFSQAIKVEAEVVSPFHSKETLNGIMNRIKRSFDESTLEHLGENGSNALYAKVIYLALTGDYKNSSKLLIDGEWASLDSQAKELLSNLSKYHGRSSPAIKDNGDGTFEITNLDLMARLWKRHKNEGGGTIETVGLRYEGADPKSVREKAGRFFVGALTEDYSRSAGIVRKVDASIGLEITALEPLLPAFSAPPKFSASGLASSAKFHEGERARATFSLDYGVDGTAREYMNTASGKLRAFVRYSEGGEYKVQEISDNILESSYDAASGKTIFKLEFEAPSSDFIVFANANKSDLQSNWVGRQGQLAAEPLKIPARTYRPFATPQKALSVPTQLPTQLFVSPALFGSTTLQNGIVDAFGKIGFKLDKNGKVTRTSGGVITSEKMDAFRNTLGEAVSNWLQTPLSEKESGISGGALLADYVADLIRKNNPSYSLGDFEKAMKNGDFKTALSIISKPGMSLNEQDRFVRAFGNSLLTAKNVQLSLDRSAMASFIKYAMHESGAVNFNITNTGAHVLQLYVQHDGILLITDQKIDITSAGAQYVAEIDIGKDVKISPSAGGGVSVQKGAKPTFYVNAGMQASMELSKYVGLLLDSSFSEVFQKSYSPFYNAQAGVGAGFKPAEWLDVSVKLDKFFMPGGYDALDNLQLTAGTILSILPNLKLGVEGYVFRADRHEKEHFPYGFRLNLSYSL